MEIYIFMLCFYIVFPKIPPRRSELLSDMILRHDAVMNPISAYISTNFFTDINGTEISPLILISYWEQLWQLKRRIRFLERNFKLQRQIYLYRSVGIKEIDYNFINIKEIFYVAPNLARLVPWSSRTGPTVGIFHPLRFSTLLIFICKNKNFYHQFLGLSV